jgi:predicted thioesterase
MAIGIGAVGEIEIVVGPADTAAALGNAGVDVLATPRLVGLLEEAAIKAVAAELPPGAGTVGTHLDVRHLAATPVGMRVRARATLRLAEGRRLVFDVEAHDATEKVAEGTHERFVIDQARFLARVAKKAPPRAPPPLSS